MPPLSLGVARSIRLAHAKQLARMQVPQLKDMPEEVPPPNILGDTLDWIQANPGALKAAQDSQCASESPDKPNWDAVFLGLMESSAMYLRKPDEMIKAIVAARNNDLDTAMKHLELAQEDVNSVAAALGCTFIQLCDFSTQGPHDTVLHSGAYCGLFISNSTSNPWAGIAFKGSNSIRDAITDLDWDPIAPLSPGVAFDAPVHKGFYYGLFGLFDGDDDYQIPFDLLVKQLALSYDSPARLHFTGHSLGGAFCTLTYGEFLRLQAETPFNNFNFGDMYSLAAPRVCLEPFADEVNLRTQSGGGKYLFRVVNRDDPVPTIPPRTESQVVDYPFIHVGGAWELTDAGAEKMADEPPPATPQTVLELIFNVKHHQLADYYASWQQTQHS
ncbi:hypothetical protein EUX98_g8494 [Antrodiella citrinella]|uniref:Fungal lipase-type domain-containing protein n=1 Tax=Antrodiella citrinella TaxID=2447956 RepID=A0A4S4M6Y6_9APHY|nr:hypothetical protein EUX98_g8494 [Antrodiella citrinella]